MSTPRQFSYAIGLVVALAGTIQAQEAQPVRPIQIGGRAPDQPNNPFAGLPTTHEKIAEVAVKSSDGKHRLQTLGIDADGRVLALAAPPKTFGAPVKDASSEVQIYSPEGKLINTLTVALHGHSVAGGPDGGIYVAGDGKVVKFSRDGKLTATVELPHVAEMMKDPAGPRKLAEEQVKRQQESMQNVIKTYKERVKALEEKKEEDRTALEKRQLEQFRLILKNYEGRTNDAQIDQMVAQITGRVRTINAITFSAKDVFIACGDPKGFGYAIWRFDHDFKNGKQILSDVRGCCGQMDIKCCGADLLIAENTKHRFARYDREGKELGGWGKRGGPGANGPECFGGCCNPMNVCAGTTGDVFTAESEGLIKRFSAKGDYLGLVASVPLTGAGCKNVAFAVSRDESRIYFLDLNGSRFLVLARKANGK